MIGLRTLCLTCLALASCAAPKMSVITNPAVMRTHAQPLKIFGIGYWGKDYMVLTLTDARGQYLTVLVRRNDALKAGHDYAP